VITQEKKDWAVAASQRHYELDILKAGDYWYEDGKGCSVGCLAHDIDPSAESGLHEIIASHLGIPQWLVYLQDKIFEGLPAGEREQWHVQLFKALPVGVDLEPIRHIIAIERLRLLPEDPHGCVRRVIACHDSSAAWSAARSARSAGWSAVWYAAEFAARFAAEFAAWRRERDALLKALREAKA
jgi:hypothetical protein